MAEKKIEKCIEVTLWRSKEGLGVNCKVHPQVEEFLKNWGLQEKNAVSLFGRNWRPVVEGHKLMVWNLVSDPGVMFAGNSSYRINQPGQLLYVEDSPLNLSFIRLVGASEPGGVSFEIRGVFSATLVRDLAERIKDASRAFYRDYFKPIEMVISVTTQEIR